MIHQGRLDLHRADVVSGYQHDIVHSAEEPEVTVLVKFASVTGKVEISISRPVGLNVSFRVSPYSSKHCWPWLFQHEKTTASRWNGLTLLVHNLSFHSREWNRGAARLGCCDSGKWGYHDHSCLGLSPRFDSCTTICTD